MRRKGPGGPRVEESLRIWRDHGDEDVRERVISECLSFMERTAAGFYGLGESDEDIRQEGVVGLMNAVRLYEPDRGVQFKTYAQYLVDGEIRHYLRDRAHLIRIPSWVQEAAAKIRKTTAILWDELGRRPRLSVIAERLGATERRLGRILTAMQSHWTAPVDAMNDGEDGESAVLSTADPSDAICDRVCVQEALSRLDDSERRVIHDFYYLGLDPSEIAEELELPGAQVSGLLISAVEHLTGMFAE